jgi:hypothetical protein
MQLFTKSFNQKPTQSGTVIAFNLHNRLLFLVVVLIIIMGGFHRKGEAAAIVGNSLVDSGLEQNSSVLSERAPGETSTTIESSTCDGVFKQYIFNFVPAGRQVPYTVHFACNNAEVDDSPEDF